MIFDTFNTQITSHRKAVSLSHFSYLVQLSYLNKLSTLKIMNLASKRWFSQCYKLQC